MPLIDPARVVQNVIGLFVILAIFFMVYSKMDKEQLRRTIGAIKRLFGRKEE